MKLLTALFIPLFLSQGATADDWPHWMGPGRDNIWREEGILETLPKGNLKPLWKAKVAGGFSGPAVANGKVFLTDFVTTDQVKVDNFSRKTFTGTERVLCLNEADGILLWKHEYPITTTVSYPSGPRCTPTVSGNKVYTLGAEGNLFCFEVETGKILWAKEFKQEYQTKSALWGYASHPLIDGDKLICTVGGEGSHTVAFHKETGREIWRSQNAKDQGYCPPSIITAGGVRQLIIGHTNAIGSLDPETGREHWLVPYGATIGSVIMTPVHAGEHLFFGAFSHNNLLIKLAADKPAAEVVWKNLPRAGMSPVNVQPILDGPMLYGVDQNGELMGVELPSGKRLWATPRPIGNRMADSGTAFIVRHGKHYFFFVETGHLVTGTLTPKGFTETSRAFLLEPTNNAYGRSVVWCPPAFANRRIYVRNDKELACFDLAK